MAPLIVLVFITLIARAAGALGVGYTATWTAATAVGLAAMFLLTASAHAFEPRRSGLIAIVPPAIPSAAAVVSLTGLLEAAGAVGLLVPPAWISWTRPTSAICLGLLMLAMFPANVYAAGRRRHPNAPATPLLPRAALQAIYLAAALIVALTAA